DGTRLVYSSDRDGSSQLYLRWMDTGQTTKLTNVRFPPAGAAWSADGTRISFAMFVPSEPRVIAKMPPAPPNANWAQPLRVIDSLVYRFDKRGYLEPGFTHLFVMPAEPGTPRQVTSGNFHHGALGLSRAGRAVWTPDSTHLIVSANRHDDWEYDPLNTEVYAVSVDDGSIQPLTGRRGPDNQPAVSPDGARIAYTGFDDAYQGYQVTRLYVMKRDGGDRRVLTENLDRSVHDPRWAADGGGLYFLYDDQGVSKLAFCTLDGRISDLAEQLGGTGSAYGGAAYSVARTGRFAVNHTRPDLPGDVAVGARGSAGMRVVTAVNRDVLSRKALGSVEEFRFNSSTDDRRIHGWIIKPPNFDASRKYPLILEIHGGPFANYGPRFDIEKQIWAARDYVVLYVNPRGSTSYGAEFGNLIHHAYPGDDFFDLNSAVDAVVAKGYVDSDNLFVTGGSGGGVLTCWMIGRTERFRAAAAAYPVINWYSFTLTADISAFVSKYWFPGPPWDHVEHYMKRSLLSVVRNVKTPTMVITGEEDYRTPISESEQYYKALKLLKVETVLVRVPGEPHGIRRRPSHHIAKVLNIVGWFDHHGTERPGTD
ncbi:MAG: S9 family peptidase, partial [Phycisphaerae bacterium]